MRNISDSNDLETTYDYQKLRPTSKNNMELSEPSDQDPKTYLWNLEPTVKKIGNPSKNGENLEIIESLKASRELDNTRS